MIYSQSRNGPTTPEYHGHDGLRTLTRQWTEHFDAFGFDISELRDARGHGDRPLCARRRDGVGDADENRRSAPSPSSGTDESSGSVYFSSREGALEAAGLEE